jgi:hypothetical protein
MIDGDAADSPSPPSAGAGASPIASTHLFRFRSIRDAARSLLRDRRRLERVDGLRFSRVVFVGSLRREGFTFGFVDPRLQLAFCIWEDVPALDAFLSDSPIGRSWREASDQYCELRLTPFAAHGSYLGHEPLAGTRGEEKGGPVVRWTFAEIAPQSLRYFWGSIRHATAKLLAAPGLIAGTAGPERLYRGAMTVTIWRSLDDAVQFAYRQPPHKQIVRRVRRGGILVDSMFIRLTPFAAEGAWPRYSRFGERFDDFAHALEDRAPRPV